MADKNPEPVRFAYIGCGFVAQNIHIPNFAAQPNCNFVALAEARKELGEKVAARYGIKKVYRSHEEIAADPATQEVYVITNNHYKGKAVANALMLKSMVTGEQVPAPSTVYEAYGDAITGYARPVGEPSIALASSLTARP